MSNPILMAFLKSAAAPAAVVALLFLMIGILRDPWRARLQGVVLATGFVSGAYILLGRLSFPPADVGETFSWAALVLAVFVIISPRSLGARYILRGVAVLVLGTVLLWPIRGLIVQPVHHRNLVAFFCLGLGVWSIVERSSGKVRLSTLLLLSTISGTALSLLLLFKASASFSQLVTVLCALLGGLAVLAWLFPKRVALFAVVPFASVFLILFMAGGHFYLDINPWHMVYLCWPFALLLIRDWLKFVPSHPVVEAIVLGILAALPLGYFVYNTYTVSGPLY